MKSSEDNEQAIKGLEKVLFGLHPDVEAIYNAIQALNTPKLEKVSDNKYLPVYTILYPVKEGVASKILFSLMQIGRFANVQQIKTMILKYEPEFNYMLSTALTKLQDENKIAVFKPTGSNKQVYYGFTKWTGKSNQPLIEFMPYKIDYSEL